ncbi:MAG: hypothetical protein C0469_03915, partial [Cyanobacteria bacterium DS2.3.42]|nr:hypothetical protein [Cyanobacteria bacterium DS2.3.42]
MTDEQRRKAFELFGLSVLSLFLELLIIRWLAQDFRIFCVFKTFALVTCFVGLGAGCALGKDKALRYAPLALLYFVASTKICDYVGLGNVIFPSLSFFQWQALENMASALGLAHVFLTMLLLVLLLSGPFALMLCIGARLGVLFNELDPLKAYCFNVGGAVCGTLLFTLISFLGTPPWLVMLPAAVALTPYVLKHGGAPLKVIIPAVVAVALCFWIPESKELGGSELEVLWSPYQRLDVEPLQATQTKDGKQVPFNLGVHISANRYGYQDAIDVSAATVASADTLSEKAKRLVVDASHHYNFPYSVKKPQDVLILGAGSGNDVASALRNGATSVDAVDIDSFIVGLGRKYHPENPYANEKVHVFYDDARNYLRHCKKKYDLINFAGLDSYTIVGQGGSMTLCNYVYTKEAMTEASKLLKPDGVMVLTFFRCYDWLTKRLACTLEDACGYKPLLFSDKSGPLWTWVIFVTGPPVQRGEIKDLPESAKPFAPEAIPAGPCDTVLKDDWPYIFITPNVVDIPYLLVVLEVLLLSLYAGRKFLIGERDGRCWQMFFLGSAFMLLELQSIARLALLYGSTWLTSAVVITGILLMILAANAIVIRVGQKLNQYVLYGLLFVSLVVSYLLPVNQILTWGAEVGNIGHPIVTFFTLFPMCMAAFIFATGFSSVKLPGRALAFNLFGAVIGALLEGLSMQFGINAMVILAALLYLGS